jgi:hypothetical protein
MKITIENEFNVFREQKKITSDVVETFMNKIGVYIQSYLEHLRKMPEEISVKNVLLDVSAMKYMFPCFSDRFRPCYTESDGNCLWHMISISLIGDQSLTDILRCYTLFTLLKYKTVLLDLICQKEIDKEKNIFFEQLVYDSVNHKAWGGGYHLLCLSTVLNKNIYIYGNALKNGKLLLDGLDTTIERLERSFKMVAYDSDNHSGFHMRYEPILSGYFDCDSNPKTLFGFFCNFHYTSLLPVDSSILLIPRNNFLDA